MTSSPRHTPRTEQDPSERRDFEAFRSQESTLILLNLCLIASMMLVHTAFMGALGMPERWIVAMFGARFAMQTGELMLLHRESRPWRPTFVSFYKHGSIAAHMAFAATLSLFSQRIDSHYTGLMVLPVVAAAFRYRYAGTLIVAALAGGVSVLEVALGREAGALNEYFEAVSTGLVFLLVAVIVHALFRQLEREQHRRQGALEELAETRERLAQEEKLGVVGRFASAVAHEIRNPIAMIASSLSAAAESDDDPELRREMYGIASTEASRLERFTGDFLSYARPVPPQRDEVHVAETLHYVADLTRAQAQENGVVIHMGVCGDTTVQADAYQLQQAMLNLVKNAIEATPRGGEVRLFCENSADQCLLHVENEGAPIPAEEAMRLFEPFHTSKPGGTGLGLGIVRNMARSHGGDASLTVNGPSTVRFTLSLPATPPATTSE